MDDRLVWVLFTPLLCTLAWADYQFIAEALNRGWLTVEQVPYTPVPVPEHPSEEERRLWLQCGFHRGKQHRILVWEAYHWAVQQGEPEPIINRNADIEAPALDMWIHCGDTDPDDLITALRDQHCKTFALFPFTYPGEEKVYLFRGTDHWGAAARWYHHKWKLEQLRQEFLKRMDPSR